MMTHIYTSTLPVSPRPKARSRVRATPKTPKAAANRKHAIDASLDADFFAALSDPTRLQLISCIAKCARWCSVGELADCCAVDVSVVSRHLSLLARASILESAKEGRTVRYRVRFAEVTQRLTDIANALTQCAAQEVCAPAQGLCCPPGSCNC